MFTGSTVILITWETVTVSCHSAVFLRKLGKKINTLNSSHRHDDASPVTL